MIEILVCKCNACTKWEVVRDEKQQVHLLCKTCGRTDEVDLSLHPNMPSDWVKFDKE